ncbi:LPS export ABC transporter periplasmic protein LptC [Bacteroidales bacterium OttesenSCG-928-A17]|nr:LPS export ABC transporter periplasmic protein LptC [Bacteroidales bacterium OttesenSCG-928-A17]
MVFSCGGSKKDISIVEVDATLLPSMRTENASELISDSGITRYRIEADLWLVYSDVKEPYWHFPEGFHLERFDSLLNVELIIEADTVYYYQEKGLWKAINNVFIQSLEGNTVETSELFYNEKVDPDSRNAIYTDKFVRINQGTRVHTGNGMRSNASLSDWRMYSSSHELEIEENGEK